jgi:hypothetical protein
MLQRLAGALLALSLAIVPARGWATCAHGADGTDACISEQIEALVVRASGAVYVMPSSALATAGFSCSPVSGHFLVLDPAAPNFKALYAALLSARVVGAAVTLAMDPSQQICTIAYATL